jgi:copper chaperone CopZ
VVAAGFPASLSSVQPATPAAVSEMLGADVPSSDGTSETIQPEKGGGLMVLVQCVIGGLLGSSCCLFQLGANLLASLDIVQIGCTGLNKWLGPIRSELRMATGAYLSAYWVWTVTRTPARRKLRQLIFTTAIYLFLTFLPEALVWSGGPALAPPTGDAQLVRLQVDGMGCEACQTHVKGLLDRSGGVITSSVDFKTGRADVYVAKGWGFFNISALSEKLEYDGYMVEVVSDLEPALVVKDRCA